MALYAQNTSRRALTPDDRFRFGKYKGHEVWQVIATDPRYVEWCMENVDGFELDNEAFSLLKKQSK